VAFGLAAFGIALQTPPEEFAVRVWSQPEWTLGRTAGLRLAAVDPEVARLHRGVRFVAELRRPDGARVLALADAQTAGSALSLTARIPANLTPGSYELSVHAEHGSRHAAARERIELVAARPTQPPPLPGRPERPEVGGQPAEQATAGIALGLYPEGGGLVPSLPNRVYLLATAPDGRPLSGVEVGLRAKKARLERPLPTNLRTDGAGLALFELHSGFQELLLELWPRSGGVTQEVFLRGDPVQVVASSPTGPSPVAGRPLEIQAEALSQGGSLHADLYAGPRWLAATEAPLRAGRASLRFVGEAVVADRGPLRVEVFRNPVDPGTARFTLRVWPGRRGQERPSAERLRARALAAGELPAALRAYVQRLPVPTATPATQLGFLLDRLPRPAFVPPTLEAAARARQAAVSERQQRRYAWVRFALAALAALVLVAVVTRIWLGQRALGQRYAQVALELDEAPAHLHRATTFWNVVALVAILAMTMLGMLLLLDHLRHGGP